MPHLNTYFKLLGAVSLWGGTFIAAKFAVVDTSVEMAALLRFVTASIALLLLLYGQSFSLPRLNRIQLIYIIFLGLTGVAIYNLFFFYGLQHVESGRGALIITSNPLWVTLGSVLFFKQKLHWFNYVGLFLCAVGVSVVLSKGNLLGLFQSGVGMGELALLGASLSWAAYTLLGKQLMQSQTPLKPLTLVGYSSVSGSCFLLLWILVSGQDMAFTLSFTLISSIGYLALLGTVAGFVWFLQGVQELGASQSSVFVFFVPVSAIILGFLFFEEPLTASLLLGAVMIIGGIVLVNKQGVSLKKCLKKGE